MTTSTATSPGRVLISAPGKVILFGEHAVVHQKTAIAASLGLCSYLYLERRHDGQCRLQLPDVGLSQQWHISELPAPIQGNDDRHPLDDLESVKNTFVGGADEETAKNQALLAFLYLWMVLSPSDRTTTGGFTICVRSFLPVSAGLGSSASFSVVLATAMLYYFGHIPANFASSQEYLEKVNAFAFKAEQVIHGNPSGVDNAVATFGGAKTFHKTNGLSTLEGFQSLRLLLTNTKVPRSTSALVAGVGERLKKYPTIMQPILDSVDAIALRCQEAFGRYQSGDLTLQCLTEELEELVDMNHSLLYAMGVSHPSLEKIRAVTSVYGLKTKLTGAGGGGCAATLLPNDVTQPTVDTVVRALGEEGFDCYQTSIGGPGVRLRQLQEQDETWLFESDRAQLDTLSS